MNPVSVEDIEAHAADVDEVYRIMNRPFPEAYACDPGVLEVLLEAGAVPVRLNEHGEGDFWYRSTVRHKGLLYTACTDEPAEALKRFRKPD